MCSEAFDPDLKICMSLDEIIHLTKSEILSKLDVQYLNRKRKKRNRKRRQNISTSEHSVPLMSSLGGGYIYVTKNSPLLREEGRRKMQNTVSNTILNTELLGTAKEIIPAVYKFVKTNTGIEKILVPAEGIGSTPINKRQLSGSRGINPVSPCNSQIFVQPEGPPPLMDIPFYKYSLVDKPHNQSSAMNVDEPDDDIVILETDFKEKCEEKPMIIDVESNLIVNDFESNAVPQTSVAMTLNDRFTRLCGSLQF